MKTRTHLLITLSLFVVGLLLGSVLAFGQTNDPALHPTDAKIASAVSKFSYWQGMLLPMTLVLVFAVKKWVKLIPDKYLPWTAPIIGGLLDMGAQKLGLWSGSVAVGSAMGALATWFHQAFNQLGPDETDSKAPGTPPGVGLWLIIGLLAFGLVAPVTTGCTIFGKTPRTVEAQKFDTFKSVYAGAREAYKTFKRECFSGRVTAANEAKGKVAWDEFRIAYGSAVKIAMSEDAAATESIIALKNQFVRLLLTL